MDRKIKFSLGSIKHEITPNNEFMEDIDNYIKSISPNLMAFLQNEKLITDIIVHQTILGKLLDFAGLDYSKDDLYDVLCTVELEEILKATQEVLMKTFPFYFPKPKKKTNTSSTKRKTKAK